jgi:hypothetical protein
VPRRLAHLAQLVEKAKAANRRLLAIERAGQRCAIETAPWERISQPSLQESQRTGALRFGDPRAMALAGALGVALNTVVGFTNKSLRPLVNQLLDGPYSASRMTYDLRRLRLKGLIARANGTLAAPGAAIDGFEEADVGLGVVGDEDLIAMFVHIREGELGTGMGHRPRSL